MTSKVKEVLNKLNENNDEMKQKFSDEVVKYVEDYLSGEIIRIMDLQISNKKASMMIAGKCKNTIDIAKTNESLLLVPMEWLNKIYDILKISNYNVRFKYFNTKNFDLIWCIELLVD